MEGGKRKVGMLRVERQEQVFEREAVLGRDAESVFPTELKAASEAEANEVTDALKEALGSVKFVTESQVEEIKAKDGGGKPTKRGRKSAPQLGALPPVGNLLQHLEPERVLVESYNLDSLPDLPNCSHGNTFVELFRSCTPYIRMHQSKIVVIHVSSLLLEKNVLFNELMQDINSPTHPLFPTCRTPFPPYVRN